MKLKNYTSLPVIKAYRKVKKARHRAYHDKLRPFTIFIIKWSIVALLFKIILALPI